MRLATHVALEMIGSRTLGELTHSGFFLLLSEFSKAGRVEPVWTPALRTRSQPLGDLLQDQPFLVVVFASQDVPDLAALEHAAGADCSAVRVIDP